MFEGTNVLEIGDNYIVRHERVRRLFKYSYKSFRWNLSEPLDIPMDLNFKKACVILNDEQLHIKLMTLPKSRPEILKDLIKRELFYWFKDAETMAFDYEILQENNNNCELLVFSTSCRNMNLLEKHLNNNARIAGVYLIQFCFLKCFKDKLKEKNYLFIFNYMESLYMQYCLEGKIFHSQINKENNWKYEFTNVFSDFLDQIKSLNYTEPDVAYFASFTQEQFKQICIEDIRCENLGEINHKLLIKSIKRDKVGKRNA
jgi:hypothetical protein